MERVVNDVPPPRWNSLTDNELFHDCHSLPNVETAQQFFFEEGRLSLDHAEKIIGDAKAMLKDQPNCLSLEAPCMLVGDIHGQFYDLHALLKREFQSDSDNDRIWLFLGDYVDRGNFGLEVVLLLFMYKLRFPNKVHLLRGNHECRSVTNKFNFKDECSRKYKGSNIYNLFMDAFDALPLAATIQSSRGTFFAVHGGLSPSIKTLEELKYSSEIDRFVEIPIQGPICDLTWSDPLEEDTADGLDEEDMKEWWDVEYVDNPTRGVGMVYGNTAVENFLKTNNLRAVIRAHDSCREGYLENWMCKKDSSNGIPTVTTLFSAPNYCGWYGNKGAVMLLDVDSHSYMQFDEEIEPYVLADNLNGFTYSLPGICEEISRLISVFFGILLDSIEDNKQIDKERLKQKVLLTGRVSQLMKAMREKQEDVVKLKGLYGHQEITGKTRTRLSSLSIAKDHEERYEQARLLDLQNEFNPLVETGVADDGKTEDFGREQDGEFWKLPLSPRSTESK